MHYEGVNYNQDHLKTFNQKKFINEVKHHFADDPNAKEKMAELYSLITGKKPVEEQSNE